MDNWRVVRRFLERHELLGQDRGSISQVESILKDFIEIDPEAASSTGPRHALDSASGGACTGGSLMAKRTDAVVKAHCNQCRGETKHDLLVERKQPGKDDREAVYWCTTWSVLECRGCETVQLKRVFYFSEWGDDDETEYFPPRVSRHLPEWEHELPHGLGSLLREIYTALHADSRRLVMMGVRAAFDVFMTEKVGDIGGFDQKLKQLEAEGYFGSNDRELLEAALDVGHAAAHRGHAPRAADVEQVVDILEHVLQREVLAGSTEELRRNTPKRQRLPSGGSGGY